jgi:hypothetical protein
MAYRSIVGAVLFTILLASVVSAGCAGTAAPYESDDPLNDLVNPQRTVRQRTSIMQQMPELIESGRVDREAAIERLQTIAWARNMPGPYRESAMITLIGEDGLLSEADSIAMRPCAAGMSSRRRSFGGSRRLRPP